VASVSLSRAALQRREKAEVSSHPADRQLDRGHPPPARGSLEPVRVVPVDGLVAIAGAVRVVMTRLHVCDTRGVIIVVERDHMIRNHVLRCFESPHHRRDVRDPLISLQTNDGEAEARTEVDLEIVSEAGAQELPVTAVDSRSVSKLYITDLRAIRQVPQASLINW
jgi:hypothetical protein